MKDTFLLKVAEGGSLRLPEQICEKYALGLGDPINLVDLGGIFVLNRKKSAVDDIADRITEALKLRGEDLESMLCSITEERYK